MRVLASGMEWFTDSPGGLPRYFADYLAACREQGHEVKAYVQGHASAGSYASVEGGAHNERNTGHYPPYVQSVQSVGRNPLSTRRVWKQAFQEELRRHHYDVFNAHFAYYAWGWMPLQEELPTVTHFHGPWAYEALVERKNAGDDGNPLSRRMGFWMQQFIEKTVYRHSQSLIVLSESFRLQLVERYGIPAERIHVIPGGVDTSRFCDSSNRGEVRRQLGIEENRFVLLTVRRLVRRMGLENLIKAVAELRLWFPDILLVMVGGGPLYEELEHLIRELKLEATVRLTNRVSDQLLPRYYQAADLTVVPTTDLEGFGFVTVESLASGTPVMGTPVGGTKEILSPFDSDLLFKGVSVSHLIEGLASVLTRPKQLPGRQATRQYALQHYTWDAVLPQIYNVFAAAGAEQ